MEEELNKSLDILVMFFTNVNTINEESLSELSAHLKAAGRFDLAEAMESSGLAASWEDN